MLDFVRFDPNVQVRVLDMSWEAAKLMCGTGAMTHVYQQNLLPNFKKAFDEIVKTIQPETSSNSAVQHLGTH